VGQLVLVHFPKAEPAEELRDVREGEDAAHPQRPGFVQAGIDQLRADAAGLGFLGDGKRANLREVFPDDAERRAAQQFAVWTCRVACHREVADLLVQLAPR